MKKWTLERCKLESSKYKTKRDWYSNSRASHSAAQRNGWTEKCCVHMVSYEGKWTIELCKADALKYRSRTEWLQKSRGAHSAAYKRGWMSDCCKHMNQSSSKFTEVAFNRLIRKLGR